MSSEACLFSSFSLIVVHDFNVQVDELLKQRDSIHSSFTVTKLANNAVGGSGISNGSSSKTPGEDAESPKEDGGSDGKDKSAKKKWFNLNLKGSASDKKLG